MRLLFAGTPDFSATSLAALLASEHEIAAVFTQPDRPAGRGKQLRASPVKQLAQAHDIPVLQPLNLKDEAIQATIADFQADVMIVVAYGLIVPQAVLDMPRFGCLNIHASLLPRWRGAAPIQRAIAAGDKESGVCIMQMEAGLDTGPVLHVATTPIHLDDTSESLHDRLADLGATTLIEVLNTLPLEATPQDDSQSCYANKLSKQEGRLDWQLDAIELHNKIRAFNPTPVAFSELEGVSLRLWQASLADREGEAGRILSADKQGIMVACGKGALQLEVLQLPGKKKQPAANLLNGKADLFTPGNRFL